MFGKKKANSEIDKEQLALIKTAQKRIRQKKRLYAHFVIFLICALLLIIGNTLLGIGKDVHFFGIDWFVFPIIIWLFLLLYHLINVFITHKFMGEKWEDTQLEILVSKQKDRIAVLKEEFLKEERRIAQSQAYEEKEKIDVSFNKQELTIIVAAGKQNAIGKDNKLIWHLSNDLKRFKRLTSGHFIIMGRKTFESFPKPLPNRTHVIITRQKDYKVPEGVIVVNSLEDAIDTAKSDNQPFIIGGGEIYKLALPIAHKIELTRVHHTFEGADTFFPKVNLDEWTEISAVRNQIDETHKYAYTFLTYKRV